MSDLPEPALTKTGRLWTYVRDDRSSADPTPPADWFRYSPDRKGERPLAHLRDYHGMLQADGYAGFNRHYETGRVQEVACWAHVRRPFYDLDVAGDSPTAREALERIQALFAIEVEIPAAGPPMNVVRSARPGRDRCWMTCIAGSSRPYPSCRAGRHWRSRSPMR